MDDRPSSRWESPILWELDRKTGAFLNAVDLGYQNVVDIDRRTGSQYRADKTQAECRSGVLPELNWVQESSRHGAHPDTRAFYIPLNLHCERGVFSDNVPRVEGGGGSGGVRRTNLMHPASPDGLGEFLALHARTGKVLWRHRSAHRRTRRH